MECELIKAALEVADSLWKLANPRQKQIRLRRHEVKDHKERSRRRIFTQAARGTLMVLKVIFRPALALLGLIAAWS